MTTTAAPSRARTARRTTVALKVAMAVTGVIFVLFVLSHMYGNLKMFQGAEAFDGYAHWLREAFYPILPHQGLLWLMRVALLASLVVHAGAAFALWKRARGARTTRYVKKRSLQQTYASRTMRWGGVIILAFVVFHILQFTTMTIEVGGSFDSPYQRMVEAFQPAHWWVYAIYLVAMVLLALHVRHGVWSALQTFGLSTKRREAAFNGIAIVVALLLLVGFMATPTAILLGIVN
ncbi:succinate dehydrogenase cytochrome b subunit [Georgenia sp. Z1491]|uniref:succinate dehydrogenase cytochrome b subunit n=1 Tax=Georgenia sp. Z1491 TaxID=3416707 RepID=UPI003CFB8124